MKNELFIIVDVPNYYEIKIQIKNECRVDNYYEYMVDSLF